MWQIALGTEPRPAGVYAMVADARLRDGQPGSAIDILKPAYERDPANDEIVAPPGDGLRDDQRYAEAMPVLDEYLARHPTDQEAAAGGDHRAVRAGARRSGAVDGRRGEDAEVRRAPTRAPTRALLEKYLQSMQAR